MNACLDKTAILDYDNDLIQKLVQERGWQNLDEYHKIESIYNYVRNEILFGYNERDNMRASEVLRDGYGQCNTKSILLMALLRAVDVSCRLHGFTVDKKVQQGVMPALVYKNAPDAIVHSWVEVYYQEHWVALEGVILDEKYLKHLQMKNKDIQGVFCGYGVADNNFQNPKVEWDGKDTYIQKESINHDYGTFNTPDAFYKKHPQQIGAVQRIMFEKMGRSMMNSNVNKIRDMKFKEQDKEANQNQTESVN